MGLFLFRSKNEMVFQKFVEIGRVAVIDQNRALIEGPGIPRTQIRLKELHLTKLKIENLNHSAKSKIVLKAWEDAEVTKKFEQSGWGKRIKASTLRANLSDFEKFKVNKLKLHRRRLVGAQVNKAAKK